jgi:hypothetical protein
MKIFFLFLCIFNYGHLFAHPRNIYKNHTYLGMYDKQESLMQVSYNSNYRLKDLAQKQIAFLHHFKHWQFSGAYQQFGNSFYNNHLLSSFVGIKFNSHFTFFTALQNQKQNVVYSNGDFLWQTATKIGARYSINSKWTVGLSSGNVLKSWNEYALYNFISFTDEKFTFTITQNYQFAQKKYHFQTFFLYQITPNFQAFVNYQNNQQPFGIGVQYAQKGIVLRVNFAYHLQLGSTDGVDLQWVYNSNK